MSNLVFDPTPASPLAAAEQWGGELIACLLGSEGRQEEWKTVMFN